MEFVTNSPEETEELGEQLGVPCPRGCSGRLPEPGAGKTAFHRGGDGDRVTSPTLAIVEAVVKERLRCSLGHVPPATSSDDLDIGWEDYLARGGVCAVEWSKNVAQRRARRVLHG